MKKLVDFKELSRLHAEDPSKRSSDNPIEQVWLDVKGKRRPLPDCSIEEITEWFGSRFPWFHLKLGGMSEDPTPGMKFGFFHELSHLIGWHWNRVLDNPYMDTRFYEIEDGDEMDESQMKVTLH